MSEGIRPGIRNPEGPRVLEGTLVVKGPEALNEFERTAVTLQDFLTDEEIAELKTGGRQQLIQRRVHDRKANIPPNAVFVAYSGVDIGYFINETFPQFTAMITPGGVYSHGAIILREVARKIMESSNEPETVERGEEMKNSVPKDFVAVMGVDGCQFIKSGEKLRFQLGEKDEVKITRLEQR